MEAKKNPSKDLSLQRNKFFLFGLATSIALMITAFEWKTVKVNPKPREYEKSESEVAISIPITNTPKVPQPILKKVISNINSIEPTDLIPVDDNTPAEDPQLDSSSYQHFTQSVFDELPEESDEPIIFAEKNPLPIGGYVLFYKSISKNLKYPRQARQIGTEGKVFVEFVINKIGEPIDLKVIRGIGAGCDEEAMRVLALTKWEPGKQRGKPVRVKMIMPIYFKLAY